MGTALNALSSLIHLEPPTTLESRYYYYPHFTDEETETRDEVACPRSHSWRGQSPNLNPGPKIVPSVEPLPWADAFLVSPYVGLTKEDVITVVKLRNHRGNILEHLSGSSIRGKTGRNQALAFLIKNHPTAMGTATFLRVVSHVLW